MIETQKNTNDKIIKLPDIDLKKFQEFTKLAPQSNVALELRKEEMENLQCFFDFSQYGTPQSDVILG